MGQECQFPVWVTGRHASPAQKRPLDLMKETRDLARMTLYLAAYRPTDRITRGGGVANEHENISVVEIELGKLAE